MVISLIVLALGTFAVGTAELMLAGVLPLIATDLNISAESAGQLVGFYALVFAVGAPVLTTMTARFSRRKVLLAALILFMVGSSLTAILPNYGLILAARILAASGSAIYSVVAMAVASNLVPPSKRGWAISIVVAGWSGSAVFGAPLATFVGQNWGWRMSFVLVIILSGLAFMGVALFVTRNVATPSVKLREQLLLLAQPAIITALVVSLLFLGGQYVLYTYLATFIQNISQLNGASISFILLVYGVGGTTGTFIGGHLADRWGINQTLVTFVTLNALALLILPFVGSWVIGAILTTFIWSMGSWGFTSAQQCRLLSLAGASGELALSLNLSAFNVGITLGSTLGGVILTNTNNPSAISWAGGAVVVGAIALMLVNLALEHKSRTTLRYLPQPLNQIP